MFINLYNPNFRNKALLEDGTIVEYDQCCPSGMEPFRPPHNQIKYLGRGTIYEVQGVKQITTGRIFEFWERA